MRKYNNRWTIRVKDRQPKHVEVKEDKKVRQGDEVRASAEAKWSEHQWSCVLYIGTFRLPNVRQSLKPKHNQDI